MLDTVQLLLSKDRSCFVLSISGDITPCNQCDFRNYFNRGSLSAIIPR